MKIVSLFSIFSGAMALFQCGHGRVAHVRQPPARHALSVQSVLVENDSFAPSTVIFGPSCEAALVGSIWGTIAFVRADGAVDSTERHVPGTPRFVSAAAGDNHPVLLWSHEPDWWGRANAAWDIRSIPMPHHSWGGRWSGPAVALSANRFAIAAASDPAAPRARSKDMIPGALVTVVDSNGGAVGSIGSIAPAKGKYLSWANAWLTLGAVAETLLTVNLTDGVVSAYGPIDGVSYQLIRRATLPRYLAAGEPLEEVRSIPWITYGGDLNKFTIVPQVSSAAFGPRGRLYAVRNYVVTWLTGGSAAFRTRGGWAVQDDGLEIHSAEGKLLGAFRLPRAGIDWLRVDAHGRIFMHAGDQVLVVADPFFQDNERTQTCSRLPDRILISTRDRPIKDSVFP